MQAWHLFRHDFKLILSKEYMTNTLEKRKDAHIDICEQLDVQYKNKTGFDDIMFVHNALPQIDMKEIDCECEFLGKKISAPIMISAMTGGTQRAKEINTKLAHSAKTQNIAFGLGSCRPILEDSKKIDTYDVRSICPDSPIVANIGAVQIGQYEVEQILDMVEKLDADALAIHLNALQEAIQPEGETNYSQVIQNIKKICKKSKKPIIVKETGTGINAQCAKKIFESGAKYVDVSGMGGTSWSKVEYARGGKTIGFEEWGYPTAIAISECAQFGKCIASGGIRSGIDIAKSISLGASLGASALAFLRAKDLDQQIQMWKKQIQTCMFLCGAKNVEQLKRAPIIIGMQTEHHMKMRGIDAQRYAQRSIDASKTDNTRPSHYI